MAPAPGGAQRTCVVCRTVGPASSRVRVRSVGDVLQLAARGGRGAWVCAAATCLRGLEKSPAVAGRSLKEPVRAAGPLLEGARSQAVAAVAQSVQGCVRAGLLRRAAAGATPTGGGAVRLRFADGTEAALPASLWPWPGGGAAPADAAVGAGRPALRLADRLRQLAHMG